jgi:hypothetical protein
LSATVHVPAPEHAARPRAVLERPHDDVTFYRASQDVTLLLVLTGSAHCQNFAATRTVLWDRLGIWAAAGPST